MKGRINLHSTSDGWRGKIADSFTFDFVERVAWAVGNYILEAGGQETFIGYDTRFLSSEFARRAGDVLGRLGIHVFLSSRPVPTPMVSFRTNQRGMVCGITITASHNPFYYNGIKVRMQYGGAPDKNIVAELEKRMSLSGDILLEGDIDITKDDPIEDYTQKVKALLDIDIFNYRPLRILVDTMHGATSGVLKNVLAATKSDVYEINSDFDPYFGGISPEPMESNTSELQRLVSKGQYNLGIAHDGDGDRIMGVIPGSFYLSPHDITVILLWYLAEVRLQTGAVIGSVTMSKRLKGVAEHFGFTYKEVPIGFRNACELMRKEKVLIAGEENGGVGFGFYLPERDATLAAALLAEAEINYEGGIREILRRVEKTAGSSGFCRLNLELSVSPKRVMEMLKKEVPDKLASQRVMKISEIDGLKLFLESGAWVNIRAAGTEELVRVYAESSNNEEAMKIAKAAEADVKKIERG